MRPVYKPGTTPQYSTNKVEQKLNKSQLLTLLMYFPTFSVNRIWLKICKKNTFSYKQLLHKKWKAANVFISMQLGFFQTKFFIHISYYLTLCVYNMIKICPYDFLAI